MKSPTRSGVPLGALPALLLALVLFGLTPSAGAAVNATAPGTTPIVGVQIASSDPSPAANSPVTFTASSYSDCHADSYTFSVDGVGRPKQSSTSISATFTSTGDHTVSVSVSLQTTGGPPGDCGTQSGQTTITVGPGVSGTINVAPDPPRPGEATSVSVTQSGGLGQPYHGYRWTVDGVADPAGNDNRTFSHAFTAGDHTVSVTFSDSPDSDSGQPAHQGTVTRTITAVVPTPTPTPTPAPTPAPGETPAPPAPAPAATSAPAPCLHTVAFQLSQFTTSGCFTQVGSSPDRWTTTDQTSLNGISFADSGQLLTITGPTTSDPGGHVKSDSAAIQIDRFVPFSGNMDWSLPAGKAGDEGVLSTVTVPAFTRLFKLRVAGSIEIHLGETAAGKYYATFPMNVELPPAFTAGPSKFAGGVSGAASIRVDADGIHYDGLKISVNNVWVGKLKVASACFSYVPAGGQAISPCAAPDLDGQPYLTCATDATTDRFDGSAVVELPTASSTQLAAFGGLAGGQVSSLGGFVDNLGTAVPIVPGVFLNRLGFGLCLAPPPLQLRGDVGVTALGGKLTVNGRVVYTDATDTTPWNINVGGNVAFNGTTLGDASVGFNAWGDVNFNVNAGVDLGDVASITGNVDGWIEPRNSTFNVSGTVQGCIDGLPCATASGLVSSTGIAGCLDLGTYTVDLPDSASEGPFGFGSVTITVHPHTFSLKGGVGYRWGGSVDLLGNSCDFSPYSATRSAIAARAARAAQTSAATSLTERIASGTQAVALRVHGTNGPPKIVLSGPGGTTITSPATGSAAQEKGKYVLAENRSDGTTSVLLIDPAAGNWTVTAAPGATSTPTTMDRSNLDAPAVLFGQQRKAGRGREIAVQYALPAGASLSLAERGKGIGHTIKSSVHGKRCRGVAALPDGRRMLCAQVKFTPGRGPGGSRQIQALVSRDGMPLVTKTIATFRVPRERLPSRPGKLRARRVGTRVIVAFPKISGASRLTASAVVSDGRELSFDLAPSCRALSIPSVGRNASVSFKIAGVRYDLQTGKYAGVKLKSTAKSAGPKGPLPKKTCR
ncbi:MAG: PKD domain-containing protein [Solirubrobacteraceae bacterium]|nr:PKD domain-containing protein [Patulibacter sp.]